VPGDLEHDMTHDGEVLLHQPGSVSQCFHVVLLFRFVPAFRDLPFLRRFRRRHKVRSPHSRMLQKDHF
jgi:hypothetical protein